MAIRSRIVRPKRQTLWIGGALSLQQLAGSTSGFAFLVTEAQFSNLGRPTVIRIRGRFHAQMDRSAEVAEDKAVVTSGIAMVEARAAAAGIGSLPKPVTNSDFSWMWIGAHTLATPTTLTEDEGSMRFERIDVDAKAMRKAQPSMALVLVTEVTSIAGVPDIECWGFLRMLLMAT